MTGRFVASIVALPRQEGASVPWEDTVAAPEGFGFDVIGIPEGADLDVRLVLTSVSEGVFVSGSVGADLVGQCSRCLKDLRQPMRQEVSELVFYPERREALVAEGDVEVAESPVVVDMGIDLEPILREAFALALPFAPLCRQDCPGLCSECGLALETLPADHSHGPAHDPRFDVLSSLEAQLREQEK